MTGMQCEDRFAGDARNWLASSILSASVLEPLHELNQLWLAVLTELPRQWTGASGGGTRFPDPVCASLATLSAQRRVEIARCPFSLFTARFNDGPYWLGIAGNSCINEPGALEGNDSENSVLGAFTLLALFFAWHLVRVGPTAARLVLGMSDQTLMVFGDLTLNGLQRIGRSHRELIAPRWPNRTTFWLQLLGSENGKDEFSDIRTLGVQMLAAELAALHEPEPSTRSGAKP